MASQINVLSCDLPIFSYSFPQVITKKTCKEYRKSFPQSNTSNVQAWHSGYNTHKTTDVFDPLIDVTVDACNNISREWFNTPIVNPFFYSMDNLWLTMYDKGDYTKLHAHFPATFSACYYVDVQDKCSPITFGDHIVPHKNALHIQPENGMLLVWIGMIPHKVAQTNSKRTCICMNVRLDKIV